MTIAATTARETYAGDGASTTFAVPFYFLQAGHLLVVRQNDDGAETELVRDVDFTVTGAGDAAGGELTLTQALASGERLTIVRNVPVDQSLDYVANDPFPAESHESGLDKLTMIAQQLKERSDRSLVAPVSEAAIGGIPGLLSRASRVLRFDAAGEPAAGPLTANIEAAIAGVLGGVSVGEVPSVASVATMTALPKADLVDGNLLFVSGYHEAGDGGGGYFRWVEGEATETDGGLVIAPDEGGAGRWSRVVLGSQLSVREFGAKGNVGVTDDTGPIVNALAAASASSLCVVFPAGTYACSGLEIACDLHLMPGASLLYNGPQNGVLATVSGNGLNINAIVASGANQDCATLVVSGNNNRIGHVEVSEVSASATSSTSIYGVSVTGDGNIFGTIRVKDLENTGQANGSFPQGVFLLGGGNHVGAIYGDNTRALVVPSSLAGANSIGHIEAHNCNDNGIYDLGGQLIVGSMIYYGVEEPVVALGAIGIGRLELVGPCGHIGVQSCQSLTIGELVISPTEAGSAPGIIKTRDSNVAAGPVRIGSVSGTITSGVTLVYLATGTVSHFSIGHADIKWLYNAATIGTLSSWTRLNGCKSFDIRNFNLKIEDTGDVIAAGATFVMQGPDALTEPSALVNFDVVFQAADGAARTDVLFRGGSFAQSLIYTSGLRWHAAGIGPYVREATFGERDTVDGVPTSGTWRAGQSLKIRAPVEAGVAGSKYVVDRVVCTASGTPGSWLQCRALTGN